MVPMPERPCKCRAPHKKPPACSPGACMQIGKNYFPRYGLCFLFSMNACIPSFWSSVLKQVANA